MFHQIIINTIMLVALTMKAVGTTLFVCYVVSNAHHYIDKFAVLLFIMLE